MGVFPLHLQTSALTQHSSCLTGEGSWQGPLPGEGCQSFVTPQNGKFSGDSHLRGWTVALSAGGSGGLRKCFLERPLSTEAGPPEATWVNSNPKGSLCLVCIWGGKLGRTLPCGAQGSPYGVSEIILDCPHARQEPSPVSCFWNLHSQAHEVSQLNFFPAFEVSWAPPGSQDSPRLSPGSV